MSPELTTQPQIEVDQPERFVAPVPITFWCFMCDAPITTSTLRVTCPECQTNWFVACQFCGKVLPADEVHPHINGDCGCSETDYGYECWLERQFDIANEDNSMWAVLKEVRAGTPLSELNAYEQKMFQYLLRIKVADPARFAQLQGEQEPHDLRRWQSQIPAPKYC